MKVKYQSNRNFKDIQTNCHAFRTLSEKVKNQSDPKSWKEPFLNQFNGTRLPVNFFINFSIFQQESVMH